MDTVAFITTQTSRKGDLILSFAIEDSAWPAGIRTLVLLRCPKYEAIFAESERGISVSMEGEREDANDIAGNLLAELTFNESARTVRVKTPSHSYDLDLAKVPPSTLADMASLLAKMNFDNKAALAGL